MATVTVDVVLLLPPSTRELACRTGALLADRMQGGSRFRLGAGYPGLQTSGPCEPHVSLFMLGVDTSEVGEVLTRAGEVARSVGPIAADAAEYRHNPYGAPEVHFTRTPGWVDLQGRVIGAVEPVRKDRLRDVDPAGISLQQTIDQLTVSDPDSPQLAQLTSWGYDEIGARFSPHVTLAWPISDPAVRLDGLPPLTEFDCRLTELAVFEMSPHGTCTRRRGTFDLTASQTGPASAAHAPHRRSGPHPRGQRGIGRG